MSGRSDHAPAFGASELLGLMEHRLGGGASGTVYSLRDFPGLAAKEVRLDALDDRLARNAEFELSALARLSHPGILRCHQVIVDDSFAYVVTDRYHDTLGSVIISHMRAREPVSEKLLFSILGQITSALAYLHGFCGTDVDGKPYQGVVHRDLKPDNVLVSGDGNRVVLADFGLCKDALRSGTTRAGSPAYMAPETLLYNSTSPASDIWVLGVIIYELATLKRPDFAKTGRPEDVFADGWKPDLSAIEDEFIRMILEKIFVLDPEERPTAKELAELFQKPDDPTIELKAPTNVLDERCKSLEAALNGVNARLELLESSLKAKTDEIGSLREVLATKSAEIGTLESTIATQVAEMGALRKELEMKSNQIDVQLSKIDTLECQCKEHLAMMKALENKIALLAASNPQSGILLLPRLMRTAHTNSIETVRMLAESGDGIGKRDEQGMTALMHAAQQGHVEPARLLVSNERSLQDRIGWTALMHAAHNNHPGVVEILAAHECGKRDSNSRTALMIAAERGHTEIVAALAPHEKGLTDSSGNTALMLAASNAHIEAVRMLVEHERGARDTRGRTALMTAAQRGDLDMVKVLTEHEKGIKDEDGRTALVHATRAGHREAAELLMEHEKDVTGWTTLMCAAVLGDVETVSQHLGEKGQKDKQGRTALILAAQNGRDEAVKLLMKHESGVSGWTMLIYSAYLGDVNAIKNSIHEKGRKDDVGRTALMWAAQQGHREAVEVLLEHEKSLKDTEGITAFTHALRNTHEDVAVILSKQEAPSWTPLMCAAFTGNTEIAGKHLSERNRKNSDGDTALMIAARVGHVDIVELLDPIDEHDVTALMRAAARGDTEMVELLIPIQKGTKDKNGNTAFTHALNNSHVDAALLLREYEAPSWTLLMHAALIGDIETIKRHIWGRSCYKNSTDEDVVSIIAAKAGHKDIVELMDPTDCNGATALMRAAERGDVEAVRVLIPFQKRRKANNVRINGRDISRGTALMIAAACGRAEVVRLLAEHECDIDKWYEEYERGYDYTALMYAAQNGHADCVGLLLKKEGGMKNKGGWTALMLAAFHGHTDCVKLLLEKEGGMKNSEGYTALMIAIQNNNVDCARLLAKKEGHIKRTYERYNTDYSYAHTCTETALDIAKANGCKAIIAILSGGVQ